MSISPGIRTQHPFPIYYHVSPVRSQGPDETHLNQSGLINQSGLSPIPLSYDAQLLESAHAKSPELLTLWPVVASGCLLDLLLRACRSRLAAPDLRSSL